MYCRICGDFVSVSGCSVKKYFNVLLSLVEPDLINLENWNPTLKMFFLLYLTLFCENVIAVTFGGNGHCDIYGHSLVWVAMIVIFCLSKYANTMGCACSRNLGGGLDFSSLTIAVFLSLELSWCKSNTFH